MTDATMDRSAERHRVAPLDRFLSGGGIVITLLLVVVVATSIAEPRFFNRLNLVNLGRNFGFLVIPSLAQMLVMTAGGFDLSVGAVMAVSSVLTATVMAAGLAAHPEMDLLVCLMALGAVLLAGGLVGAINASLISKFSLSPFMVTLAMASVLTGIMLFYTQGIPVYGVSDSFVDTIGRGQVLGLPAVFLIALGIIAAVVVLQRLTSLGRHIYAVGSDPRSARLSGVSTRRTLLFAYTMAGMLSALAGFLITARIGSGQGTIGTSLALETIVAAVIAGVSLRGGVGRAELVALAALLLIVISNTMNLVQIDSRFQALVLGIVLIGALAVERLLLRGRHA